jgi:hypothetical protein
MSDILRIDVERFFTKFHPDPADASKMVGVDYVTYGPFGGLDRSKVTEKVSRLMSVQAGGDSDNPSIQIAQARKAIIEEKYNAWKEGKEIPATGTPLAAWNLLQPEDAEILRSHRIYTVEDVSSLTDSLLQRIAIPNGRSMVEQAKLFLKSADANRAAADMAAMTLRMEALEAELREAKTALIQTVNSGDDDETGGEGFVPALPRRGRPTNAEIAARSSESEAA